MTSIHNEFQIALTALKLKHKQVTILMQSKDQMLWRNLEYGDNKKITQLAQEFDMLRQQFEKLDDGQRYAQDVSSNIQFFENGKPSKSLMEKFNHLAALKKIIQSQEYHNFFAKHQPSEVIDIQFKQITDEQMPDYIRQYMTENKVSSPIFEKVCAKFPMKESCCEHKPVSVLYPTVNA